MIKLEELTIKELELKLNKTISSLTDTHIDRGTVRYSMIRLLKDTYPTYPIHTTHTHNSQFTIKVGGMSLRFKPSVKGTGEYVTVSKTRNKAVMKPNGVKFFSACVNINSSEYILDDNNETQFKRDNYKDIQIDFTKSCKSKIKELMSFDNICSVYSIEKLRGKHFENIASNYFMKLAPWMNTDEPIKIDGEWNLNVVKKHVPSHWFDGVTHIGTDDDMDDFIEDNVKKYYTSMVDNHIKSQIKGLV